jgi:peptidoglycan/xylan/chitin deacetylase (PgdA/CDA1 family)
VNTFKTSVKAGAFRALHALGIPHLTAPALRVKGAILTFHEIHDDTVRELSSGCSKQFFRESIRWLRSREWDIVTLDEAIRRLSDGSRGRRFAAITFDDGYRDNITQALPILHREQVPFTIYVPTGAITRELFAWWLGLRELFRTNDEVEIACLDTTFSCTDFRGKRAGLSAALRWAHENFDCVWKFSETFSKYRISLESLCDRYFMNERELKSLTNDPLLTIGAHTVSHPALATLDETAASFELTRNRAYLQELLNREISHLAFPYGSPAACGPREARLARGASFTTAVTTSHRPILLRDSLNLHYLPRINIYPNSTLAYLDAELSGLTRDTVRALCGQITG